MQVVWHDGASAASETARVHEVYSREYPPGPDFAEWRDGVWARHRARPGFDLGVAESDGRVAGIAWAYVGERGQYWTDAVTASLPDDVADRWVGGHLEIVELIVLPEFRRHGLGTALLTALLARSSAERALLSVNDSALPARSLYRSLGWQELGPLGNEMTVMGTSLRGATP